MQLSERGLAQPPRLRNQLRCPRLGSGQMVIWLHQHRSGGFGLEEREYDATFNCFPSLQLLRRCCSYAFHRGVQSKFRKFWSFEWFHGFSFGSNLQRPCWGWYRRHSQVSSRRQVGRWMVVRYAIFVAQLSQRWRITRIICPTCGCCRLGEGLEAIAGYDSLLRLKPWVLSLRERPEKLEMLGGGAIRTTTWHHSVLWHNQAG